MSPLSIKPMALQNWYRCVHCCISYFCYITNHIKHSALRQPFIIYSLCCLGVSGRGQLSGSGWSSVSLLTCWGLGWHGWDSCCLSPCGLSPFIRLSGRREQASVHEQAASFCLCVVCYCPVGQSKSSMEL